MREKDSEDSKDELLDKIQQGYVKHCEKTDNNYPELKSTVDRFVGRAIYEMLKP